MRAEEGEERTHPRGRYSGQTVTPLAGARGGGDLLLRACYREHEGKAAKKEECPERGSNSRPRDCKRKALSVVSLI